MNSKELTDSLKNFPHLLRNCDGIFSADTLPQKLKKNHFIICNTDISSGPGKHWYCVVKLAQDTLELFDSLGIDEPKRAFIASHFRQRGIYKIKFNVTAVQSDLTSTCGRFVLYFLVNRFYNKDLHFTDFLNEFFVKSQSTNEDIVNKFFDDHLL